MQISRMLPVVGFDKEVQVELVHVIQDVVAVCRNQIMVLLNFLLLPTKSNHTHQYKNKYEGLYPNISRETYRMLKSCPPCQKDE